jgi:parallel beta-helix repeat protein
MVEGNYIGTTADGESALVSDESIRSKFIYAGLQLDPNSVILNNLISGVNLALNLDTGTTVQGNRVGTDATGTQAIPNAVGVDAVDGDTIGGITPGEGNTIAFDSLTTPFFGGSGTAIQVYGSGVSIEGNSIHDNTGPGVQVVTGTGNTIQDNSIYGNAGPGVWVQGDSLTGYATGISIESNSIYNNGGLGIALGDIPVDANGHPVSNPNAIDHYIPVGVIANTPGGPHVGANHLQNYPVLTAASLSGNAVTISGTFNSTPNHTFRLEFFANAAPDSSGYGQGQSYLGSLNVTTDASGNALPFTASSLAALPAGQDYLTATATDVTVGALGYGDTSEFSQALDLLLTNPTVTQSAGSTTVGFTLRNVPTVSYTMNWGDGTGKQTILAGQSNVSHVYTAAGIYPVQATAQNQGAAPPATASVVISTGAGDQIGASGGAAPGQVMLSEASTNQGQTQSPTNLVLISGSGGSDTYTVNFGSTLTTPMYLFGGGTASGDTLIANGDGSSTNVITKTPG